MIRSLFPRVEPDERTKLLFAVTAFMCVGSLGLIARTTGSTMFLTVFPAERLSLMYVASALAVVAVSFGFGRLVSELPLSRLIPAVAIVLAILTLLTRIAALAPWHGVSAFVYVFSDVVAKLPVLMFWVLATTMFNPRQAKRLFVIIGAGATLACVVAGLLIRPLVEWFGTANLLVAIALLLVVFAALSWRWSSSQETLISKRDRRPASTAPGLASSADLIRLPQVRTLTAIVVLAGGSLLLTDYLFKAAASARYTGAELASFFGVFYSASSLAALFVQVFVVHSILRRGGVLVAALVLPVSLLLAMVGVALTGSFGWIVAAKFVDPVFDFTVNATALQLLYLGIRQRSRSRGRALIDGIMKPLANVLGGLFLLGVAATMAPKTMAVIIAVGTILWITAAWAGCRAYVSGLLDSIGAHQFDPRQEAFTIDDRLFETHIRDALRNSPDEEVLYLLEIVRSMDQKDLRMEYRQLLSRESREIKVAALNYLSEYGTLEDLDPVRAELHSDSPLVKTAAIHTLASLVGPDVTVEIERFLKDDDPEVRAAATMELINNGDLEGLLASCVSLREMLRSGSESARAAAARALAGVHHQGLSKVLVELMSDSDITVRRAALAACRERPDSSLIPAILPLLYDPDLGFDAADALEVFGADVVPHLESFPADALASPGDELHLVPGVLAQTRHPSAARLLESALESSNVRLRSKIIDAYCQLVAILPISSRPASTLKGTALLEIEQSEERASTIRKLQSYEDARLLSSILEEERLDLLSNAFTLIGSLHPRVDTRSLLWGLRFGNADRKAAALEVLDNILEPDLKKSLLAVFEPVAGGSDAGGSQEAIERLLTDGQSEWVVASAAYASGRHQVDSTLDMIRQLLKSPSPYVREAALDAFSRLAPREEVVSVASMMTTDRSENVAVLANRTLIEVPG
jgi:HEAT repeat protein